MCYGWQGSNCNARDVAFAPSPATQPLAQTTRGISMDSLRRRVATWIGALLVGMACGAVIMAGQYLASQIADAPRISAEMRLRWFCGFAASWAITFVVQRRLFQQSHGGPLSTRSLVASSWLMAIVAAWYRVYLQALASGQEVRPLNVAVSFAGQLTWWILGFSIAMLCSVTVRERFHPH